VTGKLNGWSKRSIFEEAAEALGHKSKSGVSKGMDYLVTNEDSFTDKRQAAEKHGVAVITEAEFCKLVGLKPEVT
jgi:NAD-dependent DNA ligase